MIDFFEHIEDYCEGRLIGDDKVKFESELGINQALQKAVNQYPETKRMSEALLQMDILESIENAKNNPPVAPKKRNWSFEIAMMSVILAAFVYFYITKSSKKEDPSNLLFAQVYKEPIWPVVRSSEDTLMQEAMYLFLQKGDVESAKALILKDNSLDEEMRRYWVAEMYLKGQEWDSVAVYLPTLDADHVKSDRVKWMKESMLKMKK